jgi:hypothetical protein
MIYLESVDISDLLFPGVDPAPVAAIIKPHQYIASAGDYTAYLTQGADAQFVVDEIAYMPKGIADAGAGEWGGRVYHLQVPAYLLTTATKSGASGGATNANRPAEAADKLVTSAGVGVGDNSSVEEATASKAKYLKLIRGAIARDCKYTYMTKFRQNVQCAITCRLLIQFSGSSVPGGWVVPGHVVKLIDAGDGTAGPPAPVFDFYLTDVLHSINCQTGHVATELQGKYVRPNGEYEGVVKSGDPNPVWEA